MTSISSSLKSGVNVKSVSSLQDRFMIISTAIFNKCNGFLPFLPLCVNRYSVGGFITTTSAWNSWIIFILFMRKFIIEESTLYPQHLLKQSVAYLLNFKIPLSSVVVSVLIILITLTASDKIKSISALRSKFTVSPPFLLMETYISFIISSSFFIYFIIIDYDSYE